MDTNQTFEDWWAALTDPARVKNVLTKIAVFLGLVAALALMTYQTNPAIAFLLAPVCMAYTFWRLAAFLVDNIHRL